MSTLRHALARFAFLAAIICGVLIAGAPFLAATSAQAQSATSPQAVLQQANQMLFQGLAVKDAWI